MDFGTQAMVDPDIQRAIATPGFDYSTLLPKFGGDSAALAAAVQAHSSGSQTGQYDPQAIARFSQQNIMAQRAAAGGGGMAGYDPTALADAMQQTGATVGRQMDTGGGMLPSDIGVMPQTGPSAATLASFANLAPANPGATQPMSPGTTLPVGSPDNSVGQNSPGIDFSKPSQQWFQGMNNGAQTGMTPYTAYNPAGISGLGTPGSTNAIPVGSQWGAGGTASPSNAWANATLYKQANPGLQGPALWAAQRAAASGEMQGIGDNGLNNGYDPARAVGGSAGQWGGPMQSLYNQAGTRKGFGPRITGGGGF